MWIRTVPPVAVPNEDDEMETASLILLMGKGHVVVGPKRERAAMEDPKNVIERIKRYMGREYSRVFDGRPITPEFVSGLILKKLKQDAEKRIGPIGNAVVTVPYYFNDTRRKATQDAGKIAGLNVVGIMNEPTAATLTYAWHNGELGSSAGSIGKPKKAMVYDLGGGTFDVTLVQYTPTHFQVLATDGDTELGGIDWNERLANYIADEFQARFGEDPRDSEQTMQILRNECDLKKIELTEKSETKVLCRHNGKTITVTLTRDRFDQLTADLLQRTSDTVQLVLEQAKMTPKDLDAVVLVGGSTLMPQVRQMMRSVMGRESYTGISPYVSVALGAAIHAAILEAQNRPESGMAEKVRKMLGAVRQDNVNSHGLGIVIKQPGTGKLLNHVMIPKNTRLPVSVSQIFQTVQQSQRRVNVQVMEGDAPDPEACSLLGNCRIFDLPESLPKGAPVEVTYAFDSAGRINVTARDKTGSNEASIDIQRKGTLSEDQVDAFGKLAAEYKVE